MHLFSPYTIKSITFRNRIAVSPMCQYSAAEGLANNWHLVHLGSRAVGGAGLVIQEATAVSADGRISNGCLGIWNDAQVEKLKEITAFIKQQGAVPGIQLAHAGRKASAAAPWEGGRQLALEQEGWETVAPSAIAFRPEERAPHALSTEEVQKMIQSFREAALRSVIAGYEVLELHAAHGYLINQFLSPASNQRNDQYGGSFENRIRFLLEIITAVQTVWPAELPLFVRISATEWTADGWNMEDSVALCKILREKGVDLVDVSSGGNSREQKITVEPGYQVPFAARIRKETGMPTGAVGLITGAQQAEDIITSGVADIVLMARELLRNPYFPLEAAKELGHDVSWPNQYARAK